MSLKEPVYVHAIYGGTAIAAPTNAQWSGTSKRSPSNWRNNSPPSTPEQNLFRLLFGEAKEFVGYIFDFSPRSHNLSLCITFSHK